MKKNSRLFFMLVICATSCLGIPAFAQDADTTTDEVDVPKLRESAEAGSADAQYKLGSLYQQGEGGVKQDDKLAAEWFARSAEQGNADAQFALGFAYRGGFGVPRDEIQSYVWFDLSAKHGNEQADSMRSAVAELMSYDQIIEARKRSSSWKSKHADSAPAPKTDQPDTH